MILQTLFPLPPYCSFCTKVVFCNVYSMILTVKYLEGQIKLIYFPGHSNKVMHFCAVQAFCFLPDCQCSKYITCSM